MPTRPFGQAETATGKISVSFRLTQNLAGTSVTESQTEKLTIWEARRFSVKVLGVESRTVNPISPELQLNVAAVQVRVIVKVLMEVRFPVPIGLSIPLSIPRNIPE